MDNQIVPAKNKGGRPRTRAIKKDNYMPQIMVIMPDQTRVAVPVDELSAASQARVLTAKAAALFEKQLAKLENVTLTPMELKDLVTAAAKIDALVRLQYTSVLPPLGPAGDKPTTATGKAMDAIANAAASAASGTANAMMEKMQLMKDAAKKVEPIIEIDNGNR